MLGVDDLHELLTLHNHPQLMPRPFFHCVQPLLEVHDLGFEGGIALATLRPLLPKLGDAIIQSLEFQHIAIAEPKLVLKQADQQD